MTAEMLAPAARLDVARELEAAVALELRVSLQDRKLRAARHRKRQLLQRRRDGGVARPPDRAGLQPLNEAHQGGLDLAAHHRVADAGQQMVGVERGVEPVEGDVAAGVDGPHALGDDDPETERRVHRHRDGHELRARDALGVERVDRHVDHRRRIAGTLEERGRPGDREGLVAELVAGDQEDRAGLLHAASVPPGVLSCWRCSTSKEDSSR